MKARVLGGNWRRWLLLFGVLWALSGVWSLSVPLFSAPDEHAHVVRAVSVVEGQLIGREFRVGRPPHMSTAVRVPAVYDKAANLFLCYVHKPAVDAGCQLPFETDAQGHRWVLTGAARYPPLYYVLVGAPGRLSPRSSGVYGMRILSAAISSALLATALSSAIESRRRRRLVSGVFLAITPMALYLAGVVNPNGMEAAAALAAWTCGLVFVLDHGEAGGSVHLRRATIGAGVLVLSRAFSPLWLALILGTIVLLAGRTHMRAVLRRHDVRVATAILGACTALAVGWTLAVGAHEEAAVGLHSPFEHILRGVVGRAGGLITQMIGSFGFLDAPSGAFPQIVWLLLIGLVLGTTVVAAPRIWRRLAMAVVAATVAIPIALEAWQAPAIGFFYLGRYTLPLAVGIPVLSTAWLPAPFPAIDEHRKWQFLVVIGAAAGHVAAYFSAVHRYAVGVKGPLLFFRGVHWSPRVPLPALGAVFVVAMGGLAVLLLAFGGAIPTARERSDAAVPAGATVGSGH